MLTNLGISTDLFLNAQTGMVTQQREYTVVRTPAAPEYYFGNMLVLKRRPGSNALSRLEGDFYDLVGKPPLIKHRTFSWPDREEDLTGLDAYIDAGYDLTHSCVLIAESSDLRPPVSTCSPIQIRAYRDQNDWDQWTAIHLADNFTSSTDGTYERYLAYQQSTYKQLISAGMGQWWGAYFDGEQVGNLGLFFVGGVGRFQSVITVEAHRAKNICKTLVREVSLRAFERVKSLIIVADESYHAGRIYQAMGFRRTQWMASLCWEPKD